MNAAPVSFNMDLMRYASELETRDQRALPPVEKWNPDYCGELDLLIRRDGSWIHEGTPIGRARLVRLFSTVLKREGDRYYLVTPVEKLGIRVEDAPFVAVLMESIDAGEAQKLVFTTNVGDGIVAGPDHRLVFREYEQTGERVPYIEVRAGLEALVARSVYYDLVALGETRQTDGVDEFGVWSSGVFFPFGAGDDVNG